MRTTRLIVTTVLLLSLMPITARAADLAALQARFKKRFPQIAALKSSSKIGETFDGSVASVKNDLSEKDQSLVDEENADRKELYQALAAKEGVSADTVAKRNAVRNFEKAHKGEYLRDEKGVWSRKAD